MKKVLFLMLFLIILGTASLSAQVRIGGDTEPNKAAVLDLNADNDPTPAANKGALALPRVSLSDDATALNSEVPSPGMMVYNTNASMTGGNGAGIYYWDAGKWVKLGGSGATLNVVSNLDADYTALATDDVLLFRATARRNLTLPTTGMAVGKTIYISDADAGKGIDIINTGAMYNTSTLTIWGGTSAMLIYVGGGKWMITNAA